DDEHLAFSLNERLAGSDRRDRCVLGASRTRRELHAELAAATRPVAPRLDRAAMQGDETLRERQADAKPVGMLRERDVELREHVEYRFEPFARNAVSVVGDDHF